MMYQMQTLSQKIDLLIEEYSLLKHPFYQSWSAGTLTKEVLAGYSKEYYQLVKAVPALVSKAADGCDPAYHEEVAGVHLEEQEHIGFWEKFAHSLNVDTSSLMNYTGLDKTQAAVNMMLDACVDQSSATAVMYAFEKEIPVVSQSKLDGLAKFYDMTSADATDYFVLHTEADIRHAAVWRNMLDAMPVEKHEELLAAAKQSLIGQNTLLDACYESYCMM